MPFKCIVALYIKRKTYAYLLKTSIGFISEHANKEHTETFDKLFAHRLKPNEHCSIVTHIIFLLSKSFQ